MSEFAHLDLDRFLYFNSYMDENGGDPLCVEIKVGLQPASGDRMSTSARFFLRHNRIVAPVSDKVFS